MLSLNHVGTLLANHVDRVLDTAVGNDRHDGGINDSQVLDTVDLEGRVDDTLLNVLAQTSRAARVEGSLAAVEDDAAHGLVVVEGHVPGVLLDDEVLEGLALGQQVVAEADALAHGDDVQLALEEVEVDAGLVQVAGASERHLTRLGDGTHQVDDDGGVGAGLGRGIVPLEGAAKDGHEVELEVRLAVGAQGILAAVGLDGGAVDGVLGEVLVDAGEANHLEEARADGARVVLFVGGVDLCVELVLAQDGVVHAELVLDLEHKRHGRVVNQILADVTRVDDALNVVLGQLAGGANTAEHEELGRLVDALGQDDLAVGVEAHLLAVAENDGDSAAGAGGIVDEELLAHGLGDDGDVGLVLEEQEAALAAALVDGVGAVVQTNHLAVVDVLRQGLAHGHPGLGQGIAEGSHFREQLRVGDVDGATSANLGERGVVEALVVVVGDGLSKIGDEGIPGPFLATVFSPHVKGGLAAGNPGEVVERGATTEDLATGVGLLDTLVVVTLDHGGLVGPVVLGAAEVHGVGGRHDLVELLGVGNASLDDEDADIGVLGETAGNSVTGSASTDDNEVEVVTGVDGNSDGHDECFLRELKMNLCKSQSAACITMYMI